MGPKQSRTTYSSRTSFEPVSADRSFTSSVQNIYPFHIQTDNDEASTCPTISTLFDQFESFHMASMHERNLIVQNILKEDDYYELFGVSRDAELATIRKQYHKLMRVVHVDRGGDTRASAKVNYAFSVLQDREKREAYDRDRAKFLSTPILYARYRASAVMQKLTAAWACHDVNNMHDLVQGDHVYYLMDWTRVPHHGIVTSILECADGEIDAHIVDFGTGVGKGSYRPIREVPLREFLPEGKMLKRAEYSEKWWNSSFKLTCSYMEFPDPNNLVVQRAHRLCMVGQMEYALLEQSCETIAFWCKTGKRVSGQADKVLRILGRLKVAQVVTELTVIGAAVGAIALYEAGAIGLAAVEGTAAVLALIQPLVVPVSVLGAVAGLVFFGLKAKQSLERRRLRRKKQPIELINLITKLTACDRRSVTPMIDHNFEEYVQDLAEWFDATVVAGNTNALHRHVEMADRFRKAYELYMSKTDQHPGSADLSIDFATQVLVRCMNFNAFLDFPDPNVLSGVEQWVVVTFQNAERFILDARGLSFENIEVNLEYEEYSGSDDVFTETKILLQTDVVQKYPSERIQLNGRKDHSDFAQLHKILQELNPRVHHIQAPPIRSNAREVFQEYLNALIRLSMERSWTETEQANASLRENYLQDLQATEVREQLLAFFDLEENQ